MVRIEREKATRPPVVAKLPWLSAASRCRGCQAARQVVREIRKGKYHLLSKSDRRKFQCISIETEFYTKIHSENHWSRNHPSQEKISLRAGVVRSRHHCVCPTGNRQQATGNTMMNRLRPVIHQFAHQTTTRISRCVGPRAAFSSSPNDFKYDTSAYDSFVPSPPTKLTIPMAEGISDATKFYVKYGVTNQRLKMLAQDKEMPVAVKWQKMMVGRVWRL